MKCDVWKKMCVIELFCFFPLSRRTKYYQNINKYKTPNQLLNRISVKLVLNSCFKRQLKNKSCIYYKQSPGYLHSLNFAAYN